MEAGSEPGPVKHNKYPNSSSLEKMNSGYLKVLEK
jgi:hypothetical protein